MRLTQYFIWFFIISVFFFASSDNVSDRESEDDKYRLSIITHEKEESG